ncbi:MAG: NFACT RNA binding domain-containing protein [Oscillospiraceae bacterium]|nr:NFACT RNA binding domain-containing protein [Oscillospiraceae bacterium]
MSLDGVFLKCIKNELQEKIIGAKVDKVYQPSNEELVLSLRTRGFGGVKFLFCTRADNPRVHITTASFENPASPPMLCMLLRKRLGGSTVIGIRQDKCDRTLFFDFLATNEMGDKENLSIAMEIMAQYSNAILIGPDGKVIDALKRVDFSKSSKRLVLPGVSYELPPAQDKLDLFETDLDRVIDRIKKLETKNLSSALLTVIMGISPVVSREIALSFGNKYVNEMTDEDFEKLNVILYDFVKTYENGTTKYYLLKDKSQKPFDFSFMPITQYGSEAEVEEFNTSSELLDEFYGRRDAVFRMTHKTADLRKFLQNTRERIARKTDNQRVELEKCADRETLRISAELINANLYRLEKGAEYYDLENYYDENKIMRVKVSPALSPAQNSQKYFKEYKKTYTAEKKLLEQIEIGLSDIQYIDSVLDLLSRAETERDIALIREELVETGYLKNKEKIKKNGSKQSTKKAVALPPIEYETSDGFTVLVGRNNAQNDKLSLKQAEKEDMWLHTKDFPGSHVIVKSRNGVISDRAIEEAAIIAAVNSTASAAQKVPVNYTLAKNLKKPVGAKPGKVIYHVYNTIYISPDESFAQAHRKK